MSGHHTPERAVLGGAAAVGQVIDASTSVSRAVRSRLGAAPPERLVHRSQAGVWSPLEYAAHLGEAVDWYAERIQRIFREDHPRLRPYDWDRAAVVGRYSERSADRVLAALDRACRRLELLASVLGPPELGAWCIGSDGTQRTVGQLLARAVHELVRHEMDIRVGLAQLS